MGGKITDEKGELLFEFEDGQPVAYFLQALIMKAKFGEKLDPLFLFGEGWTTDLLKACVEKSKAPKEPHGAPAPKYFTDDGLTQSDWELKEFFIEVTKTIVSRAPHCNWRDKTKELRGVFIRNAIAPHPISDVRLADMIEDVDLQLESYASAFNPEYN